MMFGLGGILRCCQIFARQVWGFGAAAPAGGPVPALGRKNARAASAESCKSRGRRRRKADAAAAGFRGSGLLLFKR